MGEYVNAEFLEMCVAMNITVKLTAAESPFSKDLVEKDDFVIPDMMDQNLVLILPYPGI